MQIKTSNSWRLKQFEGNTWSREQSWAQWIKVEEEEVGIKVQRLTNE